ncbi:hypothetical protein [Actinomadura parmotrematis]|uniref:DUF1772 domain-containing protein n=1 Tax=Actinomadura parmotrematis TaxID=2864039 RepID=A0ABS7FX72_9ACTN|nr:hypothetical protein [Actinomadura parmotrematis]MBW8485017.1 hypothetical protein [Actinomadura parmotrematis]
MGIVLRILTAAGLAVDAVVHWRFAPEMASVPGGSIGADTIFYAQAVAAAVAAVLVLVRPRRWTYAAAFLVAASAVAALLLYYYVDVGALGPLPDMSEPVWYTEKTLSLVGEGVAALAALAGLLTAGRAPGARTEDAGERDVSRV